ncbi:MAG: HAMP domain-containing sensor histidine kinase [Bacteroidales bacterium]|nr:HAMP domain-containing sensor histidine kinase [Bacteroidales bacterium]
MKKFRINSIIFISAIAVIFGCNVFYLVRLYESIRKNVEREVMAAMTDADIDDLMVRAGKAQGLASNVTMQEEADSVNSKAPRKAEASTYRDKNGQLISVRTEADGTVVEEKALLAEETPYSNQMIDAMSKQFHTLMDKYIGFDLAVMDSVLNDHLSRRYIYPDFVGVEVVNSNDSIIVSNPKIKSHSGFDTFRIVINPNEDIYYKAYITPLTRHILSQMMGVIVTIFLLMVAFAAAFRYLFRTVSKLRTIEEMKDDFVSNMTHELKTPVAIAYSANDALLNYDTANDPEKKTAYLMIAMKQLNRLSELIENILAMSMERRKTMTLKSERFDLTELVTEIAETQKMRGDKEIHIEVLSEGNVTVTADKSHLANVLNNLIDNAIKYSGETAVIRIGIEAESISVADNGIGIPPNSLPYIFDKFYRVPHGNRQDVRGHGIGLYYAKHILEKMGWSISAESREGHGSVFTIKFGNNESKDTFH